MFGIYAKVFDLLDAHERRLFLLLIVMMVLVAFAEVVGISAVFVLLGVLAEPERTSESRALQWGFETFGFASMAAFQVALAAVVFVVVMAGLVIKTIGTYAIIRFANMRNYSLSSQLLAGYLHQPYTWFLARNSSDTSHRVLAEVDRLVINLILPSQRLLSSALLSIAIIGFLVAVDPLISLLAATLLCGGYALVYLWLRGRLRWAGTEMVDRGADRFRLVNELSGGFREVKLLGIEAHYRSRYDKVAQRYAWAAARLQTMSELPRFVLEALTFGVLLVLVFVLLLRNDGNLLSAIPTLGLFAYSVMRLLPALQQIYHGLASIRANIPVLDLIHSDLADARNAQGNSRLSYSQGADQSFRLTKQLELKGVSFRYPSASRTALDDITLSVPACHTVGIVGGTGAGKTTLVDLVLGLLTPDSGEILVDDEPINSENVRAWQRTMGYVPQSIYLSDDTVAANIAFGVAPEAVDMEAVERAARLAALHDFIVNDMPDQYHSIVGERGIRLSGGQRQRIGIARALYNDPSVLILDEATSALDNITERVVMEAIASLRDDKTIILIAHRLSTVRECSSICVMEHGKIVAQGSYDDLIADNEHFRKMALGEDA